MMATNESTTGDPRRSYQTPIACSICAATTSVDDGTAENRSRHQATTTATPSSSRHRVTALPRIGLDASFVNIPQSHYDVSSRTSPKEIVNGADMHEASRRMDCYADAAMSILSGEDGDAHRYVYCQSCIDRIGLAIETCSEQLDEECIVYDEVASSEEEQALLLSNVLGLNDTHGEEENAAILLATNNSFQYELDTLAKACDEQEQELRILQNLMQDQTDRSNAISEHEDIVHHELNALELDACNFGEESHLVSDSCSAVENEIDAMSCVKLMSIPFNIRINDWEDTKTAGLYPTINNLRLAYRINERSRLCRDEINAAFFNAAQLMAFTLGLYPSLITSAIQIIPSHPCAKIVVNLPEGQSVHNLGFDTTAGIDHSNHVPHQSITLFLVLLSQLSNHILAETNQRAVEPPFQMTELSIDNVDVTKLADSNTAAWSSVVFCLAANLRWITHLL